MSSDVSTGQIETREQEAFMRRLILQTGISIDGYVAALDRSHPWNDGGQDKGVQRWILDSVWAAGAHLMGRVTYEEMAGPPSGRHRRASTRGRSPGPPRSCS